MTTVTVDCGGGSGGGDGRGGAGGDRHQDEVNRLKMDRMARMREATTEIMDNFLIACAKETGDHVVATRDASLHVVDRR